MMSMKSTKTTKAMTVPEAALLDLLAGREGETGALGEAEWQRVLGLARDHGVAQLIPEGLKARGIAPPQEVASKVQGVLLACAVRNMRLFHQLGVMLRAFREAGIPVVPVKGAWLGQVIYGNVAQRTMSDVDLWLQRERLDEARKVMESLGYSSRSKEDRPQALQDALSGETQFFKPGATMVELHWNIMSGEWLRISGRCDEKAIWERTVPAEQDDCRYLIPEDAVIHLCVHLAVNHQMSQSTLRTLVDLDRLRRRARIDWDVVARRAREWKVATAVWLVLSSLSELLGDPSGELPLAGLAPSPLRSSILRRFVNPERIMGVLTITAGPKRFLFLLALVDRPRDAVRLVGQAVIPDREWLTLRYGLEDSPPWRVGVQRLWHPLRAVFRREL